MRIGVPKEIKNREFRAGLTPESVSVLCKLGHTIYIEKNLGSDIGFTDEHYLSVGAKICDTPNSVYENAELIVKVKEPLPSEYTYLNEKHTVFTFFHLAGNLQNIQNLIATGCRGIAYESVLNTENEYPILSPMSSLAGQISIVVGNYFLLKPLDGKGVIGSNLNNTKLRTATIYGAGVAGLSAAKMAIAQGFKVNLIDINEHKLNSAKGILNSNNASVMLYQSYNLEEILKSSDLIIGAVHQGSKKASMILTNSDLDLIEKGSVLIDIAIDQGGCFASSKPTTHDHPTYSINGVTHYCVTNMPGAVPLTASEALNNATLPYIIKLSDGIEVALKSDKFLYHALNFEKGKLVLEEVLQ